jgi:hypothetical protein
VKIGSRLHSKPSAFISVAVVLVNERRLIRNNTLPHTAASRTGCECGRGAPREGSWVGVIGPMT